MVLSVGARLGRYEIRAKIGEGGTAEMYPQDIDHTKKEDESWH